jgi:hypothetical protein
LEVVDEEGTARIVGGVVSGSPVLGLSDERGELRAAVCVSPEEGASLLLKYESGDTAVLAQVGPDGPVVQVLGHGDKACASIGITTDGAVLELLNGKGEMCALLRRSSDGGAYLAVASEKDKATAVLGAREGDSGLNLADEKGNLRVTPGAGMGTPCLQIVDENGTLRAAMGKTDPERAPIGARDAGTPQPRGAAERKEESSLVLFDPNGKVLWEAP